MGRMESLSKGGEMMADSTNKVIWDDFPLRLRQRIFIDANILGGEPRIANTRIAIAHIIGASVAGGPSEVFQQFPQLTSDDLEAAWLFTRALLERPGIGADLLWSI